MKTKININNYEIFAIDYIEGNLSTDDKIAFEEFLKYNPEIKAEIDDLADFNIDQQEDISFEKKYKLKKSPVEGLSYEEYLFISDMEKQITVKEKQELNEILKDNLVKQNNYKQFSKAKLPDDKVFYPNKQSLKRNSVVTFRRVRNVITAVAASVLLFFGVKFLFNNKIDDTDAQIANSAVEIKKFDSDKLKRKQDFLSPDYNQNVIAENDKNKSSNNNYNTQNQIIADNNSDDNNTDVENFNNDFYNDTSNDKIAFNEDLPQKDISYELTDIKTNNNNEKSFTDYGYSETYYAMSSEEKVEAEDVVNYMIEQIAEITDRENKVKVDIDKKNKCYGIVVNDKNYSLCLK